MALSDFQSFVEQNAVWFEGVHPETADTIADAEGQLGQKLPPSLVWLLTERGYSAACGVGSIDDVVTDTLRVREALGLPERYIVLNDWNDAGVVFLDTAALTPDNDCPVYWTAAPNVYRLADNQPMYSDVDIFLDYPAWVASRLKDAQGVNDDRVG